MKRFVFVLFLISALFASSTSSAYRLPDCKVASEQMSIPAEKVLAGYQTDMDAVTAVISLEKIEQYDQNRQIKLSNKERRAFSKYEAIKDEFAFWKYIVDLKHALLSLKTEAMNRRGQDISGAEADRLAKKIVAEIYRISQEYRIVMTAMFQNFLVNIGMKDKGHCYHYVGDLLDVVKQDAWQEFDIYWGAANQGNFRENNALVVTAKGEPFEEGLAIDAWRAAGRPYWHAVKGDRYPWLPSKYPY
jgi:hypothetical protein